MSTFKIHETVIDDVPYSVRTFSPTEGLSTLPKLLQLIGNKPLTLLLSTSEEQRKELFSSPASIAGLVTAIAENASDEGFLVVKELMRNVNSKQIRVSESAFGEGSVYEHFDSHFQGRMMHMLNVAMWVVTACFIEP